MKDSLAGLLKNPFMIFYAILYVAFLVALWVVEGYSPAEPLLLLLIMGVGFSALAWWLTRGITPLPFTVKRSALEAGLLVLYIIILDAYLIWGVPIIQSHFVTEPLRSVVTSGTMLTLSVILPFALLSLLGGYKLQDFFSLSFDWKKHLWVVLGMSLAIMLLNAVGGVGLSRIREAGFETWQLIVGIPFSFLWLLIMTGLVEEFFFRALIQARFSALFRSEIAGVVIMALIFGLKHAPQLYLRNDILLEVTGIAPSPLMAIGYSIVIVSVSGFFLGILWARTKNLIPLMLIHAAGDLIPTVAEITQIWFVR